MWVKYMWLLTVLVIVSADDAINSVQPSPLYQLPCMSFGGLCIGVEDCPAEKSVGVDGLCPFQHGRNKLECCYSVPRSSKCRSKGGECVPRDWTCPQNLLFSAATDCEKDEHCCILIR